MSDNPMQIEESASDPSAPTDPYWTSEQWASGYHWITRPLSGGSTTPAARTRDRINHLLAWLVSYHHMTEPQLQVVLGDDARNVIEAARRFNLIHMGYSDWQSAPRVYRLSRTPEMIEWLAGLDEDEWVGVCSGRPLNPSMGHVRHDVLAAELAIRMEALQPQAVFGEQLSKPAMMVPDCDSPCHGDLTMVRADGLRLVIEITSSLPSDFDRKIVNWGRLLGSGSRDELGVVVVFLASSAPRNQKAILTGIRSRCQRILTPEGIGSATGGQALYQEVDTARRSILVADWHEWFPRESDQMLVAMPCTWTDDDGTRHSVDAADPDAFPFAPSPYSDWPWMAPLVNRSRLFAQYNP